MEKRKESMFAGRKNRKRGQKMKMNHRTNQQQAFRMGKTLTRRQIQQLKAQHKTLKNLRPTPSRKKG